MKVVSSLIFPSSNVLEAFLPTDDVQPGHLEFHLVSSPKHSLKTFPITNWKRRDVQPTFPSGVSMTTSVLSVVHSVVRLATVSTTAWEHATAVTSAWFMTKHMFSRSMVTVRGTLDRQCVCVCVCERVCVCVCVCVSVWYCSC